MKPGVRVTGGAFRGRGLAVPPGARPTEGRVREALFSIWSDRIENARVLDLFAGSGVVGLEAVGRGALSALAVDDNLQTIKVLEANAALLKDKGIKVRRLTLPAGLSRLTGPFDLVFADPPYAFEAYRELLAGVAPLLAPDGEVVVEHSTRREMPLEAGPLVRVDVRRYGESSLSFYRRIGIIS
ncbi:MAG: rRNA (guanine966-N2)-methyltransferase [Acidobacteriota bacterium]|jgi:16S rRNA (guanine966-N2)-methyltransferase|nr:rRNA (guanine966-N2)-methyltransferase [Acidobacteriota bacterium]